METRFAAVVLIHFATRRGDCAAVVSKLMPAGGLLVLLMQGSDHGTGGLPHVARAKPVSKLSCPHFAHQNITAGNAGGVLQILSQMPPETVDDLGANF